MSQSPGMIIPRNKIPRNKIPWDLGECREGIKLWWRLLSTDRSGAYTTYQGVIRTPSALQRCKLDAPLLAAGLLTTTATDSQTMEKARAMNEGIGKQSPFVLHYAIIDERIEKGDSHNGKR